ncbi:SIS domain-containing protein [Paraliobacillus sp. JSM ZJ581]|uniref:SIS domain-containing protein n=1 Tax=Paraliobacillus sp. JSM ZJ581 TaxID=3342118 RepID=UPI0035A8EF34
MSMMDTIERIPVQLKKIISNKDMLESKLQDNLKADTTYKKIVIIASGTSYNAAFTTKLFAENVIGFPIEIVYPNIFVHYYNHDLLRNDSLYIFISQGGKTKLVYDALKLVKSKGLTAISLTETLDTPIASEANIPIEIGSENEEYIYRTLGYSATCATLYWLFICLARLNKNISDYDVEKYADDFLATANNLSAITQHTLAWYDKHKYQLMRKANFLFAGTNDLWPVAQEADIKFMEMLPVFTNSFELEELIHGPQNAFDSTIGYFILSRAGEDDEKASKIATFISEEIAPCYVIGDTSKADFRIQSVSKSFHALEYITFFQVLAYQLATDKGRDLTKGIYPQVTDYINKTL